MNKREILKFLIVSLGSHAQDNTKGKDVPFEDDSAI